MTDEREERPRGRVEALLDVWVLVPVTVLCWPLLTEGGHLFARDLVVTPRLPLRPEALGLGTGSPRAAPLDAVVAVLSSVVDGAVIGRVAVVLVLAAAGWAAHRAVRTLEVPARALAAGLAVWNPFVVERLGLGQWALLAGYAAVIGVVAALGTRGDRGGPRAARVAPWLALGALTPTGAVLAAGTAIVLGVRGRRDWPLLALGALVQLPWLLPALLGGARAVSDPAAVEAFAARAERPGPALWSLVGLGGIWDGQSVPGTRTGWLGHLTSLLVVAVLLVAVRSRRPSGGGAAAPGPRLWAMGAASLLVAALTSWAPAAGVVADLTAVVPGLGLLRDAQKWLAPFAVLVVVAAAVTADRVLSAVRDRAPAFAPTVLVVLLLAPFALLPDAAVVVHRVLTPVTFPSDLEAAVAAVDAEPGVLASAPWRLYRAYRWAGPYATYDPASRLFDARVVTSDGLVVGERRLGGEDPYAARVGAVLERPGPGTVDGLARLGVRWLLVALDDPAAPGLVGVAGPATGAERVVEGRDVLLLRLPSPTEDVSGPPSVARAQVLAVAALDVLVALVLAVVSLARRSGGTARGSVTVA